MAKAQNEDKQLLHYLSGSEPPITRDQWSNSTDPKEMIEALLGPVDGLKPWNPLYRRASNRKLRLFACACCRRIWDLIADAGSRTAVEIGERVADGRATDFERGEAFALAKAVCDTLGTRLECGDLDFYRKGIAINAAVAVKGTVSKYRVQDLYGDYFEPSAEFDSLLPEEDAFVGFWIHCASNSAGAFASSRTSDADAIRTAKEWSDAINLGGDDPCDPPTYMAAQESEKAVQAKILRDIIGNPFRPMRFEGLRLNRVVDTLAQAIYESRSFDRLPELADALEKAGCDESELLTHLRSPGPHVRGCWALDVVLGKE